MAKKQVSLRRPKESGTSMLTFMLDGKRVTLDFNKQGIAKVEESISKKVLKKFAALTIVNSVKKESEEE